ncbi:MAG TPA: hypothetical protein VMT95_01890 [Candidatus Binatia bacterium]|nr:hypothetical protein [Candidatus Binatia bacterium]
MRISRFGPFTLGVLAVAGAFTGCVAGGSQSAVLGHNGLIPAQSADAGIAALRPGIFKEALTGAQRPDHLRSWISPDIESVHKLLFVSDALGVVWIYKMPSLELKGILTGFQAINGVCSDHKGNVWVAMSGFEQMWKLAHDGTIVSILQDTIGTPIGCAVDPTTGNLAVSNVGNNQPPPIGGSILVYRRASGVPTEYYCLSCLIAYGFVGYDTHGNLFVDGKNASNVFALAELPAGSSATDQLKALNIEGATLYSTGMVEWDAAGHYLVIGDQTCDNRLPSCVYRAKIVGSTATIIGRTTLLDSAGNPICDMIQGTLDGHSIAGSSVDNGICGHPSGTDLWAFPAGGRATHYNDIYDYEPIGAAISQK